MSRNRVNKDAVLKVAIEIVDDKGFESLSLKQIAEKLHIQTPSLYNHIESLQEIQDMIAVEGLKGLYDKMLHSTIGVSGDTAILSMSKAYLDFARKHPGLYEISQRAKNWHNEEQIDMAEKIIQLVIKVIAVYDLKEEEVIHTIRTLRSILHGFALLESNSGFGKPISIDESFDFAIGLFLAALHSKIISAEA